MILGQTDERDEVTSRRQSLIVRVIAARGKSCLPHLVANEDLRFWSSDSYTQYRETTSRMVFFQAWILPLHVLITNESDLSEETFSSSVSRDTSRCTPGVGVQRGLSSWKING